MPPIPTREVTGVDTREPDPREEMDSEPPLLPPPSIGASPENPPPPGEECLEARRDDRRRLVADPPPADDPDKDSLPLREETIGDMSRAGKRPLGATAGAKAAGGYLSPTSEYLTLPLKGEQR